MWRKDCFPRIGQAPRQREISMHVEMKVPEYASLLPGYAYWFWPRLANLHGFMLVYQRQPGADYLLGA
jgi:hypothetical protein